MRPGMDCVLDVLRGEPIRPDITNSEWQHAFKSRRGKFCRISRRTSPERAAVPEPIKDYLAQAERGQRETVLVDIGTEGILQGFATEAIP